MTKKSVDSFIDSDLYTEILTALKQLEINPAFLTEPTFRGSSPRWTSSYISFVDYHMNYLKLHPSLDPTLYLSNLRLMLRKSPLSSAR